MQGAAYGEVDALVTVRQRIDFGEHDVVAESSVILPSVVILWILCQFC